jgi:hypothetical protein
MNNGLKFPTRKTGVGMVGPFQSATAADKWARDRCETYAIVPMYNPPR